ncbi:hypothetical protein BDN71DRAFT_1435553 [Pleurotus eryngii]|uniref:Uncharacterized protein n=1 Tax=Pleurotus eryngii TaxID=5323 RepID=A0A9P5ZJ34_PLEER|nr:hypothetical protein BDN71DRAFT_1435553 [Pleurotus eryngii]
MSHSTCRCASLRDEKLELIVELDMSPSAEPRHNVDAMRVPSKEENKNNSFNYKCELSESRDSDEYSLQGKPQTHESPAHLRDGPSKFGKGFVPQDLGNLENSDDKFDVREFWIWQKLQQKQWNGEHL